VRKLFVAAIAAFLGLSPVFVSQAGAQVVEGGCEALVIVLDDASLPDLFDVPQLEALAAAGGAGLMNGRSNAVGALGDLETRAEGDLCLVRMEPRSTPADAAGLVEVQLPGSTDRTLVMVISDRPSNASAHDELGTVIMAKGDPGTLLDATGEPRALTSDSTKRTGVVADVDPAATVADWLGVPYEEGSPIETTDAPAPLDLYERYLEQRRIAVPIAAAAWGFVLVAGIVGIFALRFRRGVSDRWLAIAGWFPATLPWLALGLLLVGHLPSLTYATVLPSLVVFVALGVVFTRWVARDRGIFVAIAACGAVVLGILAVNAALGWPAAVTPLAGGGQLDGGRFYGMPNIEIGIVLGAALYVAHRARVRTGVVLLLACALVTGSPWTGSNAGAALTLGAAAGLWLAIRQRRRWWVVVLIAGAFAGAVAVAVGLMHRYLVDTPTHVTSFLENGDGIVGAIERQFDRLQVGVDLIVDNPFALIPVVGTLILLVLVFRPPASIARSFEGHDAWRDAVLVILLASVVAYLVEDTGAAAMGFGFGFALSGLLDVSLASAREKMTR
jgi:hypothetical protein